MIIYNEVFSQNIFICLMKTQTRSLTGMRAALFLSLSILLILNTNAYSSDHYSPLRTFSQWGICTELLVQHDSSRPVEGLASQQQVGFLGDVTAPETYIYENYTFRFSVDGWIGITDALNPNVEMTARWKPSALKYLHSHTTTGHDSANSTPGYGYHPRGGRPYFVDLESKVNRILGAFVKYDAIFLVTNASVVRLSINKIKPSTASAFRKYDEFMLRHFGSHSKIISWFWNFTRRGQAGFAEYEYLVPAVVTASSFQIVNNSGRSVLIIVTEKKEQLQVDLTPLPPKED